METRKLQLVGSRSYAVCLPKAWVQHNKLEKKDDVHIETTDNNELIIRVSKLNTQDQLLIDVNIDEIENIKQFLVLCYVKNVGHIHLRAKQMDYEVIKTVREIVRYLEGYEVTNENEKEIEISFLFHEINITIRKVFQRILYLLKLQIASLEKKDLHALIDTELAIDRLYHLSKRILFSAIRNYRLRAENEIASEEDLFFSNTIVKKLESIGDSIFRLRDTELSERDIKYLRALINYLEQLLQKKPNISDLTKQLEHIRPSSNNETINEKLVIIYELCHDVLENVMSIEFDKKYFVRLS